MKTAHSDFRILPMEKPDGGAYDDFKGIPVSVDYDLSVVNPDDVEIPAAIIEPAVSSFDITFASIIRKDAKIATDSSDFGVRYAWIKDHIGDYTTWTPGVKVPKGVGTATKLAHVTRECVYAKDKFETGGEFIKMYGKYVADVYTDIVVRINAATAETWAADKAKLLGELETLKQAADKKRK